MRTAGLPTFSKLFGRNDNTKLLKGRYQIVVNMSAYIYLCCAAVRRERKEAEH